MRRALTISGLVAVIAAGLGACQQNDRAARAADNRLCTPFPGAQTAAAAPGVVAPVAAPADAAAPLDDCLHRWGYSLALSTDPADVVAQATIAACSSTLTRWNQQTLVGPEAQRGSSSALSLTTGEEISPFAARYAFAEARALFYVVQARAGKCPLPPMKDGVPAAS